MYSGIKKGSDIRVMVKAGFTSDGFGVGRIRTFPFTSDSACDSVAYDLVKTRLSESEAEAEEETDHNARSHAL